MPITTIFGSEVKDLQALVLDGGIRGQKLLRCNVGRCIARSEVVDTIGGCGARVERITMRFAGSMRMRAVRR
jgi:hypothetical protein